MTALRGVTGIVLAAGFSRRLGQPKQLLDLDGKPLLQWAIDAANGADLDEVLVVLGDNAADILERIDLGRAKIVLNPNARQGQSASIVSGVAAANPSRSGTLLMLGDQPEITPEDLNRLLAAFDHEPDSILIVSWNGETRSPVVFGREYDDELLKLTGDRGARPLLSAHLDKLQRLPIDRPVPMDVDTEADYQRLLELWNASKSS